MVIGARREAGPRRAPRRALGLLLAGIALASAFPASADSIEADAKRAEVLFNEARDAVQHNDYATACPKFAESLRLARRAGTLFNLAQCEEHEGRLVTAVQYYKEGIVVLDPGDPRLAPSKKRLTALEPRLSYLTINGAQDLPKDSHVTIDDRQLEQIGVEVPVNPGKHAITVHSPKRADNTFDLEIAEKERLSLTVTAGEPLPEPLGPQAPVVQLLGPRRIAGFVALGVGGLGAVAAGITGGLLISANNRMKEGCPNQRCDTPAGYEASQTGKSMLIANTIVWGIGIAGAATGAGLLIWDNKKRSASKPQASNSVIIAPTFIGVRGSF